MPIENIRRPCRCGGLGGGKPSNEHWHRLDQEQCFRGLQFSTRHCVDVDLASTRGRIAAPNAVKERLEVRTARPNVKCDAPDEIDRTDFENGIKAAPAEWIRHTF